MIPFTDLARLQQGDIVNAVYKHSPQDFFVEEILPLEFSGEGEHLYLLIEKTGLNTQDVIQKLQRYFSLPEMAIGFCGRKDKQAVTRQWFSLNLKKKIPVRQKEFERLGFQVLKLDWHNRKLRVGDHAGNRFKIRLRDCDKPFADYAVSLRLLAEQGAPNYFGPQRFGFHNQNIEHACKWISGELRPKRFQQSLYLSSLRSAIFNEQLNQLLLEGQFPLQAGMPANLMLVGVANRELENNIIDSTLTVELSSEQNQQFSDFLCSNGVVQQPRAMRILPQDFIWQELEDGVELAFELGVGCYATSLLREVFQLQYSA